MPSPAAFLFSLLLLLLSTVPSLSVNPDEVLDDPALEARARSLSVEIRCLVCQNQSIDDSDAQLARDLRVLVREKLTEGLTDKQVLEFLVERYGEFVLLKPRFNTGTAVLWISPFVILGIAGMALFLRSRKTRNQEEAISELSDEERQALSDLLKTPENPDHKS